MCSVFPTACVLKENQLSPLCEGRAAASRLRPAAAVFPAPARAVEGPFGRRALKRKETTKHNARSLFAPLDCRVRLSPSSKLGAPALGTHGNQLGCGKGGLVGARRTGMSSAKKDATRRIWEKGPLIKQPPRPRPPPPPRRAPRARPPRRRAPRGGAPGPTPAAARGRPRGTFGLWVLKTDGKKMRKVLVGARTAKAGKGCSGGGAQKRIDTIN